MSDLLQHISLLDFAVLVQGTMVGSMLFFGGVMAPLIFIKLPADVAGPFIRQVFPVYYLVLAGLSLLAAALSYPLDGLAAAVLLAVGAGFVAARQLLMPAINRHRDAQLAGEGGGTSFDRLHRTSVVLNYTQLAAAIMVMIWLVR
ncbi:MAG: DUF4149 domain-containing protein [Xanthomonadales bacterium]|nr:DUF4149 domain-containing protein [Xanthomonadales bacterium]